jgi:alkylation response protein AidB-like acyl-CoA dehydrogenase
MLDYDMGEAAAALRGELRNLLREQVPPDFLGALTDDPADLESARRFCGLLAERGLLCMAWPEEFGGRGASPWEQTVVREEMWAHHEPRGAQYMGVNWVGPAIMRHGTEEQRRKHLPPIARGEVIWCQGFSEPNAGSDLANLATRAVKDGDDYVINGQKIWTSGAHRADWGVLVTRSDTNAPKHKGLTYFFLDMKSPGIEIRRIKQISGASNFNEVYFTDVRIPDSQRLGAVGHGWGVAITTLMNERLTSGEMRGPDWDELFALTRKVELENGPAIDDAGVREKLADWYVRRQGVRWSRFRVMTALSRGETPGPENSIGKLVAAAQAQDIAAFAMDLLDMGGVVSETDVAPMRAAFQESVLSTPGSRIAAGTDEILKNIIAERVLGLPADVRVDKDQAFKDLPTGKR